MEKAYAQALMRMIQKGKTPKEAVHALKDVLDVRGRSALMPRISRAFEQLAARESKKNEEILYVAKEKDAHRAMKEAGAPKDARVVTDPHMIGGWRLEGRGVQKDASYKRYLLDLYRTVLGR